MSFKEKVTSSDVKVLGHIYLVAMLLLILRPRYFCLATAYCLKVAMYIAYNSTIVYSIFTTIAFVIIKVAK